MAACRSHMKYELYFENTFLGDLVMETVGKAIMAKDWLESVSTYVRSQDEQDFCYAYLCLTQGWITPTGEITPEGKKWVEGRGDIDPSCLNSPEDIVGE